MVGTSSRPSTACSAQAAAEAPAEGNVYASKTELLEWINGLLQLQLSRLEQFASGAVFCQLLDAFFGEAINMSKVNFHASTEYEAHFNYKVLQTGFTAIHLTREIHVTKLARGSRTELLELLQYLFKYLLKLKAQANYNARERRALAVKGGTDSVAIPAWLSGSQAAGRGGVMQRSSGNWGSVFESPQDKRGQLRSSTSSSPAHAAALTRSSSNTAKGAVPGPCSPAKDEKPQKHEKPTAAGGDAGGSTGDKAACGGAQEAAAGEEEVGVAIYQVVQREEEEEEAAASARAGCNEPGSVIRLVIPDEQISSSMVRPLSPGGRSQLQLCLAAAEEGMRVLGQTSSNMAQIAASLASGADACSHVYHGKARSLLDAAATTAAHVALLLADAVAVCDARTDASVADVRGAARDLQAQLAGVAAAQEAAAARLQQALDAAHAVGDGDTHAPQRPTHLQLTQLQKQLASTAALDGCLRSVGTACAALTALGQREGAAVAASFFVLPPQPGSGGDGACGGSAGAPPPADGGTMVVQSKVLRLSDCAMKRLRNGDVYRGRYLGVRKNGEGTYCFVNQDVYEGGFKDDRMDGNGVYSFLPEGRYEGSWLNALYEGHGSETFAKGSTYRGQYASGLRHGMGACRFFNGDFYEGNFVKGLRDGCGMQQCTDDSNYCGEYARGKRHGYGVYSFPNGDQYLGEYEDDIPQGYGVYVFGSGQRYEGCWEKGKKHGWSIYTVETGQRWAGSWVEGKPHWVHPLPEPPAGTSASGSSDGATQPPQSPGSLRLLAGLLSPRAAAAAPEVADNLKHAQAACRNAQQACTIAESKLAAHWTPGGRVQDQLAAALSAATQAAASAQAMRTRARQLAARLNAAAVLIEDGGKGARMELVAHPLN